MKKFILVSVLSLVLITPFVVSAQQQINLTITSDKGNACTNAANSSVGKCVSQVYIWSLGAAAILALLMIVIGGYITLTAAGNAERATRGKSYITSSLIGLAMLLGAYLLLNTINPDLTNFNKFDQSVNGITPPASSTTPTTTQPRQ